MSGRAKKPAAPRKKANGYKMPAPLPNGEVINDTIGKKKWRLGPSIGVGGFGEIYSACDHEASPKKGSNYPFVIKIEPHENGPLFVEKHFYLRNANKDDISNFMKSKKLSSLGMPLHFGGGSHEYQGEKYRYLVLERYGRDLWSIFLENGRRFPAGTVFLIGLQMLDVLEYIHSRGYVHADIKGANILLGLKKGTENQAYLVDFGLTNRVNDKEFKPDPKCAHNGTIEYTSRDAHLGVSTMRGDLEILGYNMLQWLVGELPWEKNLKDPKTVQAAKEAFMNNVKGSISKLKGSVPDALVKFFEYINTLKPKEIPNHTKCRQIFETFLKSEGITRSSKLSFSSSKGKTLKTTKGSKTSLPDADSDISKQNGVAKVSKRGRTPKSQTNSENDIPDDSSSVEVKTKKIKRKSTEPSIVVTKKKTKIAPKVTVKATPPVKRDHANISTQTSIEKLKKDPRQVSFDSPIAEVLGERRSQRSINSSGDIFEDSFTVEEKIIKKKKRVSDEDYTVKKVVKKKVIVKTKTKTTKTKSWRDAATVVNGRAPPSS